MEKVSKMNLPINFSQFMMDIAADIEELELNIFRCKYLVSNARYFAKKHIKGKIIIVPEIVEIHSCAQEIREIYGFPFCNDRERILIISTLVGLATCGSIVNTFDNIVKTQYKIQYGIQCEDREEKKVCKGLYLQSDIKYPDGIYMRTEDFGEKQRPFHQSKKKTIENQQNMIDHA